MLHCVAGERQREYEDDGLDAEVGSEERVVALADAGADPEAVVVEGAHAASAGVAVMRAQRRLSRAFAAGSQVQVDAAIRRTLVGLVAGRQQLRCFAAVLEIRGDDAAGIAEAEMGVPGMMGCG